MNIFIMIGAPGSGKTTWVKRHELDFVSRDVIRADLGLCSTDEKIVGTSEEENLVTKIERDKIISLLKGDKDFAIDDTNVNPKFRKKLLNLIKSINKDAIIIGVKLETNLEDCLASRENQIPEKVITKMWESSNKVKPEEFDQFLAVTRI